MFNDFSKSTNTAAMAEATFGKNTKYINTYKTLSVSLDGLVDNNLIERPNLIKIDVDGNEKEVIDGSKSVVWEQAQNRMYVQQAILNFIFNNKK